MNALYLTYVILAAVYFLLGKKWHTKWLQQGNYLFLALVATLMILHDCTDFLIAYFSGYLSEQLNFYQEKLGTTYLIQWIGLILLPALGIFNYFSCIRQIRAFQIVLWAIITSCLLYTTYLQQNLDVFLPFFPIQQSVEPGWHTTIVSTNLSLLEFFATLLAGVGITAILSTFLKHINKKRRASLKP